MHFIDRKVHKIYYEAFKNEFNCRNLKLINGNFAKGVF